LPVFNAGNYLASAIESVLQQTFTDFDLLLLNDGSTDDSLAMMRRYAALDARCHVITRENRGLVHTLNEGVELARAEVLFRMDADDLCLPTRFAKQMSYLDGHPECVAVGSRVMLMDPDGDFLCPFVDTFEHAAIDAAHMQGRGGAIVHPAAAMRRKAILAVGGYRSAFKHAEDLDLFLRMAEQGQIVNLPEIVFRYRLHTGSIGYKHRGEQIHATRRAIKEAKERRGLVQYDPQENEVNFRLENSVEIYQRWAWWALSGRNVRVARKYAWSALKNSPLAMDSWRLLYCAMRGR
jgi:glycosyltransferase involved in cell wall biosynthesis